MSGATVRAIAAAAVLALGLGGAVVLAATPAGATSAPVSGTYAALPTAYRALDTLTGAAGNRKGALAHGADIRVSLAGHVPSSASAALVSISTVNATASGTLIVYGDGVARPGITSVTVSTGSTPTTTVLVPLKSAAFRITNAAGAGSTQVIGDVLGYYNGGSVAADAPGRLQLEPKPHRVLSGYTTLAPGASVTVAVGPVGVKSTVAVELSVNGPKVAGSISAYPYETPALAFGTLYYTGGAGLTGLAFVRADTDGKVTFTNRGNSTTRIAVDLLGHSLRTSVVNAGSMQTLEPQRIASALSIRAGAVATIPVDGRAGVSLGSTGAVALTVLAGASSPVGGLVVGAPGHTSAATRTMSWTTGQTVSVNIIVPTSAGKFEIRNVGSATANVYVNVLGYFPTTSVSPPAASTSHYLTDLTTGDNSSTMNALGCSDAKSGATFVLLDIGAQSHSSPELSASTPGVAVALSSPTVRLTYSQLNAAIASYLAGFSGCASAANANATVALGTNNSGNFTDSKNTANPPYSGADRGTDWWAKVVQPARSAAGTGVSVVGAIDIENGDGSDFDTVWANANAWETSYLSAAGAGATLIFNGAANGCPTSYGSDAACADGWTLSQFATLTHSTTADIEVLPQIYIAQQAVQWADIDRVAGGKLTFAGALNEYPLDSTTLDPAQSWTALYRAINSVVSAPVIPRSVAIDRTD